MRSGCALVCPVIAEYAERDRRRVLGGERIVAGDGPVGCGIDADGHINGVALRIVL